MFLGLTAFGGARLQYALHHWSAFAHEPTRLLGVDGGLHAAGAVAAVLVSLPVVSAALKVPAGALADGLAPTMFFGTVLARIGCFLEGCCRGSACVGFWCVVYPAGRVPVHPLPLYFATLGIVAMVVALVARRRREFVGEAALVSSLAFAVGMVVLEIWRDHTPARSYWAGIPQHSWLAVGLVMVFATLLGGVHRRRSGGATPGIVQRRG